MYFKAKASHVSFTMNKKNFQHLQLNSSGLTAKLQFYPKTRHTRILDRHLPIFLSDIFPFPKDLPWILRIRQRYLLISFEIIRVGKT